MIPAYLVIDVEAILDQSQIGQGGAALLKERMQQAEVQSKGLRKQAGLSTGEMARQLNKEANELAQSTTKGIENARFTLRTAVLNRAQQALQEIAEEQKISLVLERKMVVLYDEKSDITEEVIKRIDAQGPLEI